MGGHGGLNILPQKRWNVYGQRNRLKVYEDETEHAEEEKTKQDKREKAEREFRTGLLRKRAHPDDASRVHHINLFEEEERRQEHEEKKKERELEDRKRGRKSDRTSDAKFDARFAFGHGLNEAKPWYARSVPRLTEPVAGGNQQRGDSKTETKPHRESEDKGQSKKEKKRKKARALLKELKKSNFKKSEIDVAMLRIERLRREKQERTRIRRLGN